MTPKIKLQIIDRLRQSRQVLITAHKNPDGDSLGSQLGLAGFLDQIGVSYQLINEGAIPDKFKFLPDVEKIHNIETYKRADTAFDSAVIIECSTLDRIGRVRELIGDDTTVINIDHHQDNRLFGDINFKDVEAAAAGQMIYEILRKAQATITEAIATNLYTAILTDTGRFHYSSTTPACMRVASELLERGADPVSTTESVYYDLKPRAILLTGLAISSMQYKCDGRLCLMTIDRKMMIKAGAEKSDTEGLVNYSMYASGVQVGILFTEVADDRTKISFRSRDDINVAEMAAQFGGGGHINASGCIVEMPLAKARDKIIEIVRERLNGSV